MSDLNDLEKLELKMRRLLVNRGNSIEAIELIDNFIVKFLEQEYEKQSSETRPNSHEHNAD